MLKSRLLKREKRDFYLWLLKLVSSLSSSRCSVNECVTTWIPLATNIVYFLILHLGFPLTPKDRCVVFLGHMTLKRSASAVFWVTSAVSFQAPLWAYLLCAVGLFIYQSLDAIDGKQARRTNSSSPLGELFDHGCDSLSTGRFPHVCVCDLLLLRFTLQLVLLLWWFMFNMSLWC